MRLFGNLLLAGALGSSTSSNSTDCTDRQIRLWMHIDLTGSFNRWRQQSPTFLKKSLNDLVSKYPNLKLGVSGFGDRPLLRTEQMDDQCYVPGVDLDVPFDDSKLAAIKKLTDQQKASFNDAEEDPLTALPWIAKNKFGDYEDDELRLLVVLTDFGPHYAPLYKPGDKTGVDPPDQLPEDFVTCDSTKRWGYIDELMDPVKTRRIFPLFTVYSSPDPRFESVSKWETALELMKYEKDHFVNLGSTYDPDKFTEALERVIDENKCSPAPTNAPSNGTIQTDPAEASTSAAPADTTAVPGGGSTTNPHASTAIPGGGSTATPHDSTTNSGGTTMFPGENTTIPGQRTTTKGDSSSIPGERTTVSAATSTTKGNRNDVFVAVGASAGIAALLAAGAGYKFLKSDNQLSPDIEEDQGGRAYGDVADREAAVVLGEDAYE